MGSSSEARLKVDMRILMVGTRSPEDVAKDYTQYGPLKADAAAAVIELIRPIQTRFAELAADPGETSRLLALGAEKARAIAEPVLDRARVAIGLTPR